MAHHQDRDYALVIGINDYPLHGSDGKNLKGAIPDAKRFADWLTDRETGGGLPPENCHLVTSAANPMLRPVSTEIDMTIAQIGKDAKAAGGGRRFYLFFAGHGQSVTTANIDDVDVALCMPQWSRDLLNAALSSDHYFNSVRRCIPFDELVAFFDCCRSRTLRAAAMPTAFGCQAAWAGFEQVRGMMVYAAEDESRAFETGEGDEARGYFTSALLAALQGGAARPEGGVTWKDLWQNLQANVPRLAQEKGRKQTPRIRHMGLPDDAVFGAAKPVAPDAAPNFTIHFGPGRVGPISLLNAEADRLRKDAPETGPWQMRLDFELHTLVDSGNGDTMTIRFAPDKEGGHVTF